MTAVGLIPDYQTHFSFERLAPCDKFIGPSFLTVDVDSGHTTFVGIGEIDFAVDCFWPATLACAGTVIDVEQYGVGAEPADQVKAELLEPRYKRQSGEGCVSHH